MSSCGRPSTSDTSSAGTSRDTCSEEDGDSLDCTQQQAGVGDGQRGQKQSTGVSGLYPGRVCITSHEQPREHIPHTHTHLILARDVGSQAQLVEAD